MRLLKVPRPPRRACDECDDAYDDGVWLQPGHAESNVGPDGDPGVASGDGQPDGDGPFSTTGAQLPASVLHLPDPASGSGWTTYCVYRPAPAPAPTRREPLGFGGCAAARRPTDPAPEPTPAPTPPPDSARPEKLAARRA